MKKDLKKRFMRTRVHSYLNSAISKGLVQRVLEHKETKDKFFAFLISIHRVSLDNMIESYLEAIASHIQTSLSFPLLLPSLLSLLSLVSLSSHLLYLLYNNLSPLKFISSFKVDDVLLWKAIKQYTEIYRRRICGTGANRIRIVRRIVRLFLWEGELCNVSFIDHRDDNYAPIGGFVSQ